MKSITTREMTTRVGAAEVPGLYCLPPGSGPFPAVVVLHGSDGFKPNHRFIAEKLAVQGMAAYAPTWFGGDPARPHWDSLRPEEIPAAVADFRKQAPVDAERTALMGFSRGGGLALIMGSRLPGVRAIVNYFGLTAWAGGLAELPHLGLNPDNPLDFLKSLDCPILSFHGDQDTVVPVDNTHRLEEACQRYGVAHQYVIYPGVNHSFIWEDGDKYDTCAHRDSWQKALAFLRQNLLSTREAPL